MCEDVYWNRIKNIRRKILVWGEYNYRYFSWRNTGDPYKILIAEVMLHRTKASQVACVYNYFVEKYPDFSSLCKTGQLSIRNELYSLGLVWRADLLYQMAIEVERHHSGKIPLDKKELLSLPGIGDYIASAVLCFSQDLPEPILDANTVRVIGRIFDIKINDYSRRSKKFRQIMFDIVNCKNPKKISLLLIDFATLVCIPSNTPKCTSCQLKDLCSYHSNILF